MQILLTKEESLNFFYEALCDGLSVLKGYGLELDFDRKQYAQSRKKLLVSQASPCFEDVLIKMLKDGFSLKILDHEGKGENNRVITIADVYQRVKDTPLKHLVDKINEEDDALTADAILQTVFFKDLVFG